MRVVLRSAFDVFSGFGRDAVDIAVGLDKVGVDVVPTPTAILPGLPRAFTRLLEKSPLGPPDVVLSFTDPTSVNKVNARVRGAKSVLYSMWERTPLLARDWEDEADADLSWLDRVLVTCQMNVDAFRPVCGDVPIGVVPGGIDPKEWPVLRRDPARAPMRFLMCGVMSRRKDPFAVLTAWRELTATVPGWDAELFIHTTGIGLHPKIVDGAYGPGITLSTRILPREDMLPMFHGADVMVCPSHGEGNNKPPMEFMASGGAVIASDWSGHQNWLHRDVAWPVPGRFTEVPEIPAAQEFTIDHDALVAAMREAWEDRGRTSQMGVRAGQWARQTLTWDRSIQTLVKELEAA